MWVQWEKLPGAETEKTHKDAYLDRIGGKGSWRSDFFFLAETWKVKLRSSSNKVWEGWGWDSGKRNIKEKRGKPLVMLRN